MSYTLRGVYELSKPADKKENEIRVALSECIQDIFKAHASLSQPDFTIKGKEIEISITSDKQTHSDFYRVKKALSDKIGKSLRIGVKSATIRDYTIKFPLEKKPLKEVTIPFVKKITIKDLECTIHLEDIPESYIKKSYIERIIRRIKEKIENQYYEGKDEFWELMDESSWREPKYKRDPTEDLIEKNWAKQGPTKGKWFYRPQLAALLNAMRLIVKKEILEPLGFQEVVSSGFVPVDTWQKTGHIIGVPNEIYYISEPKSRDPALWEEFKDMIFITREVPREKLKDLIAPPFGGVTYAQCPNIYWSFNKATIPQDDLPLKMYESTVISARYESGGRHGIERTDEFHRIEIVYIGLQEQMLELREKMLDKFKHIFDNIFEINWRKAWVTPWYMQQSDASTGVEDEVERIIGTIDFETYLPYRGKPEDKANWLEFQNYTIAGNKFTKGFNIKTQRGELWSGCCGVGLERWVVAFLAQNGLDPEKWPKAFRKYLPELPKGFNFF
ncbi:MAG: serine--tRNA ligase [Candidatus Thorarchaeota archaeon]|jgi:seryl-tRNA synthetase